MCDERADNSPCDGGAIYGSSWGAGLDIVAPSYKIRTTHVGGSYVAGFAGSSAAAPHVAGAAALVLSLNPCMTVEEVKRTIYMTCDKPTFISSAAEDLYPNGWFGWVGAPICYWDVSGHPYGLWNQQMGYGRLNAHRAVQSAFHVPGELHLNKPATAILGPNQCPGSWGDLCWFEISNESCTTIANGAYLTNWYRVERNITYPYTPGARVLASSNGMSQANLNNGQPWCGVSNMTNTSATIYTYAWYAVSNLGGQQVGWVGNSPNTIRFDYTVTSSFEVQEELQNEFVLDTDLDIRAANEIKSGFDVTAQLPNGNYIISGASHVQLYAGKAIHMEAGSLFAPGIDGGVTARVGTFATCPTYPEGLKSAVSTSPRKAGTQEVSQQGQSDHVSLHVVVIPNPVAHVGEVWITVDHAQKCSLAIVDTRGLSTFQEEELRLSEGVNRIVLNTGHLSAGLYSLIVRTALGHSESQRFVRL